MSKINAVRFINLNYNHNAIRIADETFQMEGKTTLLSLRNGGGKSVLVQMMTAPFVHKQYRKTKDRPFESYFTTAKPSFILVEWKLDDDAGFCLTGMMVRKNQSLEENSTEPLEILNFITEYSDACEQDIAHLPVVEKVKNEIVLKSYSMCRQIFEEYKKDPQKKFFSYDMNQSAQARQYFEKLSEYRIYYKEWENIIRKVNVKESGLSELFSDCKNEKELIEKWFIEAIESKLNRGQNRMKEFQTILEKYMQTYQENKAKIERRDTILRFKEEMGLMEEKVQEYRKTEETVSALENRIAAFRQQLHVLEQTAEEHLQGLEEKQQEYKEKISYLLYEKMSVEVHRLEDELRKRSANYDILQLEMDDLERDIKKIEKQLQIYDCAKQQQQVTEEHEEYELLKQKIEVLKADEKELEPQRKTLGGYLKQYYREQLEQITKRQEQTEEESSEKRQQREEQKKAEEEARGKIEYFVEQAAFLKAKLEDFDEKEKEFNQRYAEHYTRNILGEYEPGMLAIKREESEKQLQEYSRSRKEHGKQQLELAEKKKSTQRIIEDKRKEKRENEVKLQLLQNREEELEEQIRERQKLMRYLEIGESYFWQREELLSRIDHKLKEIDLGRKNLEQEERQLQQEWKKLTLGEVLEVPKEFQEILADLDLHPVYGMQWLQKNGYSMEENQKLIRLQPFLPYSLILPRAEIKKLQTNANAFYTSYPIPLLVREKLEEALLGEESQIVELSGVHFYLWFNEKLLDEDALRLLILEKEEQIRKKQAQIENRKQEYQDYTEKKSILKNQTLTQEMFMQNKQAQEEAKEKEETLEKEILNAQEMFRNLEEQQELLSKKISEEEQQIREAAWKKADVEKLQIHYEEYLQNRKDREEGERQKEKYELRKEQALALQERYEELLKSLEWKYQQLRKEEKDKQEKSLKYALYKEVSEEEKTGNVQEWEARYEAITSGMSYQLQEVEMELKKVGKKLEKAKTELKKKQKKFGLEEKEWLSVIYQEEEQLHQEILLEDREKKYKGREYLSNEEDKKIGILRSRIEDKEKGIQEQCGFEKPLEKSEIRVLDFDAERNQLKYAMKEIQENIKLAQNHLQNIQHNQNILLEYENLKQQEPVLWEEDFASMDPKHLNEFSGMLRRDYRQATEKQKQKKEKVQEYLQELLRQESYRKEYYRKPLEAMLAVSGQAALLLAQLSATMQSYESQMEKLAVDIAMVEQEKGKIKGLLEDYVKDVHENMAKIDDHSTITIRNRPIKMLRLQLPDWEAQEGLYQQRLEDYMEELTQGSIRLYEQNQNPTDFLSARITTKYLYDTVVGVGNLQIKLYKIEELREYPITWADVAKNSGGEGFLSAFVILSSLLHYMRRDETELFVQKNEGKVLVMDNPFAQTNAAHLLKPLMDMAKKTNTQLICLSGLGGDSIYSRFDNIYVLNLVTAGLRGGMQYLRGEHIRGTEEENMVVSRIEVLENQELLF